MIFRKCKRCGKDFILDDWRQKYCSEECSALSHKEQMLLWHYKQINLTMEYLKEQKEKQSLSNPNDYAEKQKQKTLEMLRSVFDDNKV